MHLRNSQKNWNETTWEAEGLKNIKFAQAKLDILAGRVEQPRSAKRT